MDRIKTIIGTAAVLLLVACTVPTAPELDTRVVVNSSWEVVSTPKIVEARSFARAALDDYVASYNAATPDDQLFVFESETEVPPIEESPDAPLFIAEDADLTIHYQTVVARVDLVARRDAWKSSAECIGDPDTGVLIPCTVYVDRLPPAPPPPPVPQLWVALVNWTTQTIYYSEEYATDAESLARYRALATQAELNNLNLSDMDPGLWSAYRGETAFAFPPTVEPEPEPEPPVE